MIIIKTFQALVLLMALFMLFFTIYEDRMRRKHKGAYFLRTKGPQIEAILELLGNNKAQNVVDLGSGSGRILFKLASHGYKAVGYEINPLLYLISKFRLKLSREASKIEIYKKDFWEVDLSEFDVVIVFGISYMMDDLEDKLLKELGSKVISVKFEFSSLKAVKSINNVHLYHVPS